MRAPALALALLLVAPAIPAWSVEGNEEPGTPQDVDHGMWLDAPDEVRVRDRVYFNVIANEAASPTRSETTTGGDLGLNALPGMRVAPHSASFTAWLGIWRDCDGDGYVGSAMGALWVYRAELPHDPVLCPPGTDFDRDGWVYEFLWISYVNRSNTGGTQPLRYAYDRDARVWGDLGAPGDPPSRVCELTPTPRGTMRSTGGLLAYAGCHTAFTATDAVNALDADGSLGLRFDDPRHPEAECDHPLNRPTIWGDPRCPGEVQPWQADSGKQAVGVWDCEAEKDDATLDVRDPTAPDGHHGQGQLNGTLYDPTGDDLSGYILGSGTIGWFFHPESHNHTFAWLDDGDGSYAWFSAPKPHADHPADGSYYDAANEVRGNRGCHGGDRPLVPNLVVGGNRNWLWWTQPDSQFFRDRNLESPRVAPLDDRAKRSNDVVFQFQHKALNEHANFQTTPPAQVRENDPVVQRTPYLAGATMGLYQAGGGWSSTNAFRPPAWRMGLLREDLAPAGAVWATFYAQVGPNLTRVLDTPPGGPWPYGAESCPEAHPGAGISANAWDCDPTRWWNLAYGAPERRKPGGSHPLGVPVGERYHLRDVDCFDGRLAGPAHASLSGLSEDPGCPA
ncbi:MAG TPA: hypothetical protein VHH36_03495 [Candidatus Thermoplasmatota archaeon]|nr:hypothetical protein [Candidatus Thermoplasmatota archaeon]